MTDPITAARDLSTSVSDYVTTLTMSIEETGGAGITAGDLATLLGYVDSLAVLVARLAEATFAE